MLAERAYFRIADAYAALQRPDPAIAWYEALPHAFPDAADAPAALWNAAPLRAATGDTLGAAADFERYARTWPDLPDAAAASGKAAKLQGGPPEPGVR